MASFRDKLRRLEQGRGRPAKPEPQEREEDLGALRAALARALNPTAEMTHGRRLAPELADAPSPLPFVERETAEGPLHERRLQLGLERRIGAIELSTATLADPATLSLLALTPQLAACDARGALYLDTETSGLGSGTANVPFLVGLAYMKGEELVVEQLFLRDRDDEVALLETVRKRIAAASMLVSYNGKSFDLPVLRARYVMNGLPAPPERPHLDLLHLARRVHRHRRWSKSLTVLEREVLRFRRGPDIAGEEVAARYRHYLRSGREDGMLAVVEHNEHDVISLAALLGLYGEPLDGRLPATELASVARVMRRAGALDRADRVAQLAVERGAGAHGLRARADIAKARGDKEQALCDFEALAATVSDPDVRLELAKLYEHYQREPERALAMVEQGTTENAERSDHRRRRLQRKLARATEGASEKARSPGSGAQGGETAALLASSGGVG